MRKIFLLMLLCIILINQAYAQDLSGQEQFLGTFKYNQSITLLVTCDNCTYVNLSAVTYPNGTFALIGENAMNKVGNVYWYNYTDTSTMGDYYYTAHGDLRGIETVANVKFTVNGTGNEFTTARALIYFMAFLILVFLFIVDVVLITKMPGGNNRNERNEIISINKLKYFKSTLIVFAYLLIVSILLISSSLTANYLGEQGLYSVLFTIFKLITMWQIIIVVAVLWLFYILWNVISDIKLNQMLGSGYNPQ